MRLNPAESLKRRLGAAIEWRVHHSIKPAIQQSQDLLEAARQADREQDRAAVKESIAELRRAIVTERDEVTDSIAELGRSMAHISALLTDQQRSLGQLLEELDRRVIALEK